jgi:predicted RNase H-like nuclease (RuvC/YqgF family)
VTPGDVQSAIVKQSVASLPEVAHAAEGHNALATVIEFYAGVIRGLRARIELLTRSNATLSTENVKQREEIGKLNASIDRLNSEILRRKSDEAQAP